MYIKYNSVLRCLRTEDRRFRAKMVQLCCSVRLAEAFRAGEKSWEDVHQDANSFVTTIYVINSAIVKLGKLTIPGRLYRGLSGGVLPAQVLRIRRPARRPLRRVSPHRRPIHRRLIHRQPARLSSPTRSTAAPPARACTVLHHRREGAARGRGVRLHERDALA